MYKTLLEKQLIDLYSHVNQYNKVFIQILKSNN